MNPDLSTLPNRMRYAAKVVSEAQKRYSPGTTGACTQAWSHNDLVRSAAAWEKEDAEKVEVLAKLLSEAPQCIYVWEVLNEVERQKLRDYAKKMINLGWIIP
ncbi:MAG: hypothetical protein A4E20_11090 [Nitrospira sp. SG-bin2]|uniref:hypothetical protein n=1 Tax=Nitrospira cf. moscoviensis SBR1015 TaxID=96242 RepID=UPI000A0C0863|nr:hypothetical protein [Nitrospira cf. moscoviensis SBR1015]OQW34557.1 MAG: hypothetical protein A4E20_11090 [Nitrospira sp. SG-bin2]